MSCNFKLEYKQKFELELLGDPVIVAGHLNRINKCHSCRESNRIVIEDEVVRIMKEDLYLRAVPQCNEQLMLKIIRADMEGKVQSEMSTRC